MDITLEQVTELQKHADVGFADAKAALEAAGGNLLDALIELERRGKVSAQKVGVYRTDSAARAVSPEPQTAIQAVGNSGSNYSNSRDGEHEPHGGAKYNNHSFSKQMKGLWKSFCGLIHKGNINQFEVWRLGECIISVPVNILILALLFFFWITLPVMLVALFFGCSYKFRGPNLSKDSLNDIMDNVSETAESIKRSLK
jgi:hypothetical protein